MMHSVRAPQFQRVSQLLDKLFTELVALEQEIKKQLAGLRYG